jgi:L-threonylcarbamoyladenylate synthase
VVLPTDTVYGVGARPDIPGATAKLFRAKGRPRSLTLPVLLPDVDAAERVAPLGARIRALAERFWPGPLTMVVPRGTPSREWDLGDERDTVGLRVPDHAVALALLAGAGPLAVTSANRSGEPTPPRCDGVQAVFGDDVDVYLCAGRVAGRSSTVVDLTRTRPRVLRRGGIPELEIQRAWASTL